MQAIINIILGWIMGEAGSNLFTTGIREGSVGKIILAVVILLPLVAVIALIIVGIVRVLWEKLYYKRIYGESHNSWYVVKRIDWIKNKIGK